ncbi:MAG: hypothetical protein K5931_03785 [Lachnospiraceae bacterium]|nr:hypothetical protein [Lachnospiraceae bacterium]
MKDLILEIIHLNNDYTYGNMYMGMYFLALVLTLLFLKEKKYRDALLWPALILVFGLYILVPLANKINERIFFPDLQARFIWILLVAPVTALIMGAMIKACESKRDRGLAILLLIPFIFFSGEFKINANEFKKAENLYKLPQALLDISDEMLSEKEEPKVIVPYEIAHVFRQYSTDIMLLYGEDATFYRIAPTDFIIQDVCREMEKEIPNLEFINKVAKDEKVDYIVFDSTYHNFGMESINIKNYPTDPDYVGDRSVTVSANMLSVKEFKDEGKDSIHWDLSKEGLEYVGTYGQYLLYKYER